MVFISAIGIRPPLTQCVDIVAHVLLIVHVLFQHVCTTPGQVCSYSTYLVALVC